MTHPITHQIRVHEREVHYKELGDIINDAMYCGFIVAGKAATISPCSWSPKENLYFLQK
jgi:23S rRNA-/tRNA-specific pseudouridylate synthase